MEREGTFRLPTPPSDPGPTPLHPLVLDHERAAWLTTLYEANARMVFNTCRRLLRNPEDAADATHEVFLRAAVSLHAAPDSKDARAWLTTVARNHSLDVLRRKQRFQSAITTLGASVPHLESETVVVDRQLAQTVLEQLAVRERQALWESHVEQRPVAEIAERLGLSYLATAQLLSRARRRAALVLAALAAILAVLRGSLARRRLAIQNAAQPVAAVIVVPLVVTVLMSGSSGPPSGYAMAPVGRAQAQAPRRGADVEPIQTRTSPANPSVAVLPSTGPTSSPSTQATVTAPVPAPPAPAPIRVLPPPRPAPTPVGPLSKKKLLKRGDHDDSIGDRGEGRGEGRGGGHGRA